MGIKVECSNGHTFKVKDKYAGRKGLCPRCQVVVLVPDLLTSQETEASYRRAVAEEVRAHNASPADYASSVLDDALHDDASSSGSLLGSSVIRHHTKCKCGHAELVRVFNVRLLWRSMSRFATVPPLAGVRRGSASCAGAPTPSLRQGPRSMRLSTPTPFVLLAAVAMTGCQSGGPRMAGLNPFYQPERTTYVVAAKRMDEIRKLAEKSTGEDTPDQQTIVQDLVKPLEKETDPLVRQATLETAAKFNTTLAGKTLIAGLSDESPFVREAACRLLASRPTAGAVEPLTGVVRQDESFDVRVAAAQALEPNGAKPEQLLALLEDPNPAMQLVGVEAMRNATGKDYGGDVAAYVALARGEAPPAREPTSVAARVPDWVPFF
ncbi:unnamed protein product [Symbiodinium sp. KB8]|nr:unnamed protein product [Symbiodinium sp. KB8]